jgi:hypothetical protein
VRMCRYDRAARLRIVLAVLILSAGLVSAPIALPTVPAAAAGCTPGNPFGPIGKLIYPGSCWLGGKGVDVYADGPGSNGKYQCTELVVRLYQSRGWIKGSWPYANGDQMWHIHPANLTDQKQGDISRLGAGDAVSMDIDLNGRPDPIYEGEGHVGVVSTIKPLGSGLYRLQLVNQNGAHVLTYGTWNSNGKPLNAIAPYSIRMDRDGSYSYPVDGVVDAPTGGTGGGAGWKAIEAPLPANAATSYLSAGVDGLSCPSDARCVAGGYYIDKSGIADGLLLTSSGGSWKAAKAPLPLNAKGTQEHGASINAVSCPSVSKCVAVGTYTDKSGDTNGLLLTFADGSWKTAEAKLPLNAAAGQLGILDAVSCPSTSSCFAGGTYATKSGPFTGLLMKLAGTTWKASEAPVPAGAARTQDDSYSQVLAMSCPSSSYCAAGGDYVDTSGNTDPQLLTFSGGAWKAAEAPLPPNGVETGQHGELNAVSCPSVSKCVAGGFYTDHSENTNGMLLNISGMSRKQVEANFQPEAIACFSATNCVASGGARLFILSGGSWKATTSPVPSNGSSSSSYLRAVSCFSVSKCVAGGSYSDKATNIDGLLLTGSI